MIHVHCTHAAALPFLAEVRLPDRVRREMAVEGISCSASRPTRAAPSTNACRDMARPTCPAAAVESAQLADTLKGSRSFAHPASSVSPTRTTLASPRRWRKPFVNASSHQRAPAMNCFRVEVCMLFGYTG
jgi:hypothetical protein